MTVAVVKFSHRTCSSSTVPATMAWRRFARYRAHSLSRSRCVTPSCTSREACIWSAVPDVVRAGIGLSLRVACNALGCARPRRPALFTERRVGALCTQTRRFQAVRTSYVSPCRNTVSSKFEVLGPRNGRGPTSSKPLKVKVKKYYTTTKPSKASQVCTLRDRC